MAKAAKRISFIDLADEVRREGEFTDTRHVVTVRRELMARIEASASPSTRRSNSSIALPGRSSGPPLRSSKTSTRPGTPRAPRLRPSAGRYERYQHRGRAPWWRTSPPSPPHHQPSPQKKKGLPMDDVTCAHDAPPRTAAFDQACGMEDPLRAIRNFALTLDRVAQTLDDDNAAAIVQELGLAIQSRVDELDEIHGYFCRLHHPEGTTTTEARA
jgi:hypothetical protein